MNPARCITCLAVLIAVTLLPVPFGHAIDDDKPGHGKVDPAAPPETTQFDFLVGDWYVEIKARTAGDEPVTYKVDWTIRYILGGWALQDTWRVYDDEGNVYVHGTMFRTYSKERKTWTIVEQVTPELEFTYMTAEKEGDTMVMYEHEDGFDGKVTGKRVFSGITADGFDWFHHSTVDGGKTWKKDGYMKAVRKD